MCESPFLSKKFFKKTKNSKVKNLIDVKKMFKMTFKINCFSKKILQLGWHYLAHTTTYHHIPPHTSTYHHIPPHTNHIPPHTTTYHHIPTTYQPHTTKYLSKTDILMFKHKKTCKCHHIPKKHPLFLRVFFVVHVKGCLLMPLNHCNYHWN